MGAYKENVMRPQLLHLRHQQHLHLHIHQNAVNIGTNRLDDGNNYNKRNIIKYIFNHVISWLQSVVNYVMLHTVQPSSKYNNKQY